MLRSSWGFCGSVTAWSFCRHYSLCPSSPGVVFLCTTSFCARLLVSPLTQPANRTPEHTPFAPPPRLPPLDYRVYREVSSVPLSFSKSSYRVSSVCDWKYAVKPSLSLSQYRPSTRPSQKRPFRYITSGDNTHAHTERKGEGYTHRADGTCWIGDPHATAWGMENNRPQFLRN